MVTDANSGEARPTGRQHVSDALKSAALALLTEKGPNFSVREVADRARVNQGLIYRHFGSKDELITAVTAVITDQLASSLARGESPIEIMTRDFPDASVILARLVLDGSSTLVEDHPVIDAMLNIARNGDPLTDPSPGTRVAVAGALLLGWMLFRSYFDESRAGPLDPNSDELVNLLVRHLLDEPWPTTNRGT